MRAHRPPHRSAVPRPTGASRRASRRAPRRHPARVYWVRRLVVLIVLAAEVVGLVGLGRLLTGPADGGAERATSTAGEPEVPEPTASAGPSPGDAEASRGPGERSRSQSGQRGKQAKPPPAEPDGPCVEEDVVVTPSVAKAVGGSPITIRLDLTTIESEACTWTVSPETVTMRITRDEEEIWSSLQCPGALPRRDVVVRQDRRTRVKVSWSARLSDDECSRFTDWALPGDYDVEAAALAGEPRAAGFEITRPEPPVITRKPEPKQGGGRE